jgi:uncharacterized protein YecE (DUF72 family)
MSCEVRIGCSGWHYKHWRGPFYDPSLPASRMLDYYAARFDTVEINNSFYRLPSKKALEDWRDSTPGGFRFAMKASRYITHNKKLGDPESALEKFFPLAEVLRPKLGPILFQLPPKWRVNAERLDSFLRALPRGNRYAFELRNPTWLAAEIYAILRTHNAAFCIFDLGGFQTPLEVTADFAYVRLHGPNGPYQGSYSPKQLDGWARRIRAWKRKLKAVYVYFDNDQEAYAARDALALKRLISPRAGNRDRAPSPRA